MKVIFARNVCEALPLTLDYFLGFGTKESSRAGDVIVSPCPMAIVTVKPQERVLFSAARDANPFFHMFEAIWMLAGKKDARLLDRFIKDFSARFAENDGTLHDAYGFRWRYAFGIDQLDQAVKKLTENPNDRQVVIQMWNGNLDLIGDFRSKPCNTNIYLRVRNDELDMTVCCRSNDMIWGCHGANAVHFSILQEYLAARIDADIGVLYQISNNAHIYLNQVKILNKDLIFKYSDDRYVELKPQAMFIEPQFIDEDIRTFFRLYETDHIIDNYDFYNPWFYETFTKALEAHKHFKNKEYAAALITAQEIEAEDWQAACYEWIERRMPNK